MFKFVKESVLELKKITWPKYGEVIGSGKQVFWLVVFISIFLGIVDYIMYLAITYVF
ncbi:preprotein translocase subunit SecE [Borrelia sp. MN22-0132]|uniref:Protein translocase subunit SecE n=4 Tax=Borrelia TaxID=138 RepID=A0A172XB34_BORTU|nr:MULTISPECIES: preprotein translocase subunit SecE [Borrelia]AAX17725.1 protein translocase subunit SecE [Borrelia turicatae 91E135]AHE62719.1 preprotein translocase subunit SecE [Borrelia parkeri HR1]AHH09540.1 Protein translocase subunit secE [Borrelia parkeri SLO]ANF33871.1 preprotein translocase subunit SecE [Borrelia turicatae]UPA10558.1 preprotein translocase subunit SecE [Borrelia parkeri]